MRYSHAVQPSHHITLCCAALLLCSTGAVSLVGTPDYSAPEVLRTGVFRIENEDRVRKGKKAKTPSKDKGEVG